MATVNLLDEALAHQLRARSRRWLVTGSAGFIGSHLVETLLRHGQSVVGLDNFATGHRTNLEHVRQAVSAQEWARHQFLEADITDLAACQRACAGVDIVLHQAALGSVPRSIADPMSTHRANVDGFLNMLIAARDAKAQRFVYASSSAVYGDEPNLPKVEPRIGRPLSPYAAGKHMNEIYADVFGRCYGLACVGLRYFNVFGARQDPEGPYAAVIPLWIKTMLRGEPCFINGDGETSRDFCFIANVVQVNLRSALVEREDAVGQVYNVALGGRTTLKALHAAAAQALRELRPDIEVKPAQLREFRAGDVRHSQADISKAQTLLGYAPTHDVSTGLREAMAWYVTNLSTHA